jgi:predicted anti-sigma-YlaC factor YlaD
MAEPPDMTCQELVELVNDYLEGVLPPDRVELFEQHLAVCQGCESYVDQLRTTVATVGRIGVEDLSPDTRDGLLDAFRGWRRS